MEWGKGGTWSECGGLKGSGQTGVQSECVDTTWFRRLVHKDSCFEHEGVRHILQSVWKWSSTYNTRNQKHRCSRWVFVFLMGPHQFSYVSSRILPKASFFYDNQEQQGKCAYFSDFITMRTRKDRVKQVVLCFWSTVPLRTDPHTYHLRSARSCIHLHLHVKGSVRLFCRHCETRLKTSQNPLSCLHS